MNAVDQHVAALGALYGPSSEAQVKALPDMAEGLQVQLERLSRSPTPAAREVMAGNLAGAQRAVLRLREALMREAANDATN